MRADKTLYFIEAYEQASLSQITVGAITGESFNEIKEVTYFNAVETKILLQPQQISDPADEEGLFVDLLGVYWGSTFATRLYAVAAQIRFCCLTGYTREKGRKAR